MAKNVSAELREFIQHVNLETVECVELKAGHRASTGMADGSAQSDEPVNIDPTFTLFIETPEDDEGSNQFGVKLRIVAELPPGDASVTYRAVYNTGEAGLPAASVLMEFVNEVAVMTLIPYLREALADVTRRVFVHPLVMPMFQRGELRFSSAGATSDE